jgi:hypothetical protein
MTDDVQHRTYHHTPGSVEVRDVDEDGVFGVRMPIVTTGKVRNDGDEPFTREELEGMRDQVANGSLGVFLDHGASNLGGGGGMFGNRYSAAGKLGEWADPEVSQRDADDESQLVATARLMDPETLPAAAGDVREALTVLKEQADRGMSLAASIGWREDEDAPGGNDVMETSIVGIPADPRTTSDGTPAAVAARALAADSTDEFEQRLEQLRAVVSAGETDRETSSGFDQHMGDTDDNSDTGSGTDRGESSDGFQQRMLEHQREQTELLRDLAADLRENTDGDEDDEDDDEEDEDDEQSAGEPQTLSVDGEEVSADDVRDLREDLDAARDSGDIDTGSDETADAEPEPTDEQNAEPKDLL